MIGAYSGRHDGMDGNAPIWYLGELWTGTGIASVLALCQIVVGSRRSCRPKLIVAGFMVSYFLFICLFSVRNDRTGLPLVPCVLLLAAIFLADLGSQPVLQRAARGFRVAMLVLLGLAVVATPTRLTVAQALRVTTIDSRTTSREWINTRLPPRARVAVESYSPYVDPARFTIVQAERAIDHSPGWYLAQNVDYIVLSQGMFGRYFGAPRDHVGEVARYVQLMDSMRFVKKFDDGGYEVLVYATRHAVDEQSN